MLCETVLNLSTINTLTYLLQLVCYVHVRVLPSVVRYGVCSWNNQHPFHRAWRRS